MKRFLIILSGVFLFSCNNTTREDAKIIEKDTAQYEAVQSTSPDLDGCYLSVLKRDSANLRITVNNGAVSGTLDYSLYEKDRNRGTVSGAIKDSLIILNYTFQSEGISSIREVVFKVVNGELLEGHGEIIMKGDTAAFKEISKLEFPTEYRFVKAECP